MPHPWGCEELRRALACRGRDGDVGLPEELRLHVNTCRACRTLVAAVRQVSTQPAGSLYTPALRRRTLAAVRRGTPRTVVGLAWLLFPPAGLGALAITVAPAWVLARMLQALPVSPALAWATAAVVVLSTNLAASALVAILVGHPHERRLTLTGTTRSSEV